MTAINAAKPIESLTINIAPAGAMLGMPRGTAYRLAKQDRFPVPVIRFGRRMVVSRIAIEELLSRRKDELDDRAA